MTNVNSGRRASGVLPGEHKGSQELGAWAAVNKTIALPSMGKASIPIVPLIVDACFSYLQ